MDELKRILAELSVAVINYLVQNYAKVQKGLISLSTAAQKPNLSEDEVKALLK